MNEDLKNLGIWFSVTAAAFNKVSVIADDYLLYFRVRKMNKRKKK